MKLRYITGLVPLMIFPFSMFGEPLEVGSEAPRLEAPTQSGAELDLGVIYDQGPTLVYFYPKANTSGCTAQACNLRDNFGLLGEYEIQVVGVSRDTVEAQAAFHAEYNLPFPLIADEDGSVMEAFGVPPTVGGLARRQSFLVLDGTIVWRDLSAAPNTQTEDALAAYRALREG